MNWDKYFINICNAVKEKSKDNSTKVGSVIVGPDNEVISVGYNGFPRGIDDDVKERYERPLKYVYFEHSERNAIYNAARIGVSTKNCKIYLTLSPCADCARAIIQSGIKEVILQTKEIPERWKDNCNIATEMLSEAGVAVRRMK